MADGVVSFLLEKLSTLLSQKYKQLEGLEGDVQYIMNELDSMRGFLRKAEAKQDYGLLDAEQQAWIQQVREVAYDMEDAVDEYLLRFADPIRGGAAGFRESVRGMCNSIKNLGARYQISSKIRGIKERVEHIAARHQRYQSTEGIVETTTHQHPIRGHALLLTETDLVGINKPKTEIISLILNDNSHMKAISVVGMGGLGKTTLVKRVYETPDVKNAFSVHAWLTISQTLRIEDALKDLIRQIRIPGELDSMDADGLRAFVRDFLKVKRYIIVLDDLWGLNHWDSIKYVFPDDNCGSSLVITTRNKDVAVACCRQCRGNVYRMRSLSADESWNLFCKKTFGEHNCPSHLKDIANRIITKCRGLPLGIVAIGGLLALKDTSHVGEWDMVLRNLGSELAGSGKLTPVSKILFLSYNDLPYYLKSCLLYLGIFAEDTIVDTNYLTCLWIAEGFVEVRPGMTVMEVAQSYLNELIDRSLIQVVHIPDGRRVEKCRVHDLIHEIILSKCKENNILTKVSSTPNTTWPQKVRRLVVDDSIYPEKPHLILQLRSLLVGRSLSASSIPIILNSIQPKLLKVLDLRYVKLSTIPKEVFKLTNLTYLNLEKAKDINIPKSIGMLRNLEYLNLKNSLVPEDIKMLNKLCYLNMDLGSTAANVLGWLFSLQYLKTVMVNSKEVIHEIGKLTQLRVLHVRISLTRDNGRELCSSLEKLVSLQKLNIILYQPNNDIGDLNYSFSSPLLYLHHLQLAGPLVKVPDWVTSFHGLSTLLLCENGLREDPIDTLADLPNLVHLTLRNDAYVGNMLYFKAEGFQKLKCLYLSGLNALELVLLEEGTMSDLEMLIISNCKLLEEMPLGIQYLTKLRKLGLSHISGRLHNKLRNQKMDGQLEISHIHIGDYINGEWKWERL